VRDERLARVFRAQPGRDLTVISCLYRPRRAMRGILKISLLACNLL